MSLFSIGGNFGFALGPIAATPLVLAFGLSGGLLLAVPGLAVAVALLLLAPFLGSFAPERGRQVETDEPDRVGALLLLLGVIAFRSVAWFGLITFVPLWEVSLGHSKAHGNHLLSLMLLAGGLGTLAAGPLADRFGRRPVLVASSAATAPLILVFVIVGGVPGAIALAGVGISVIATFGVTMVMSQEYLPRHIGMASGLSIGLSIGLGGDLHEDRQRRAECDQRVHDGQAQGPRRHEQCHEAATTFLASVLELHQHRASGDAVSLGDVNCPHDRLVGSDDGRLHLHRLEHDERLARLDAVSLGHHDADDRAGHRCGQGALLAGVPVIVRGGVGIRRGARLRRREVEPPGNRPGALRQASGTSRKRRILGQERRRRSTGATRRLWD